MIIDTIGNMERYAGAVPGLRKAMEVIASTDWQKIPEGQYRTDDPAVRYNVFSYTADAVFSEKAEYHRKEIDVQILISGKERMDLSPVCSSVEVTPYSEEKEAGFVRNEGIVSYAAAPGFFALFFPGEPHAPSLRLAEPDPVKKVVFKILA